MVEVAVEKERNGQDRQTQEEPEMECIDTVYVKSCMFLLHRFTRYIPVYSRTLSDFSEDFHVSSIMHHALYTYRIYIHAYGVLSVCVESCRSTEIGPQRARDESV